MNWPLQRDCDLFYGNPRGVGGRASAAWEAESLVVVAAPFQLYYGSTPVKGVRVHRKCAESLRRVFARIWDAAGHRQDVVDGWGASKFAGSFVFRNKRGGATLSMHSYGCAIDLDPARNAMGNTRPNFGKPGPLAVVKAFEAEGWEWGGRWSGRSCDGMHFQAARTKVVTRKELLAAGSRTIAATEASKGSIAGIGLSGAGAVGLLSQTNDAAQQVVGVAASVADGKATMATLGVHWQVVAIVALLGVSLYLGWRLWKAQKQIEAARLDDAATGVYGDQVLYDNPEPGNVLDGVVFEGGVTSAYVPLPNGEAVPVAMAGEGPGQRPPIYPSEWQGGE
jgi:membrane protein implicated in regulation of membrane protease activity